MRLFLDLETFSDVPLDRGVARYCEGQIEILLTAYAIDDGAIHVEDGYPDFVARLVEQADEVVIHNAKFDRAVLAAVGSPIPLAKTHCTMAQARSHGLPGGLGDLCAVLGVAADLAKSKDGRALIQLFCKPRGTGHALERANRRTHPAEWQRFRDYAALDIAAMRDCYRRMPVWNYGNPKPSNIAPSERAIWMLDQVINERGFAVDTELATTAIAAVAVEQAALAKRTAAMTYDEVQRTTQRDALLRHLLEFYGVDLPDLQKGTLERRLLDEDLPEPVRELLAIRLEAAGVATSKYKALIKSVSSDGRLRGTLEYCGAARTGRWAGRTFQPQNLPRPRFSRAATEEFIEALKVGAHDILYDDIIARASSAVRGALVAPPGRKLVIADLSNIEGRMLAWLAGETWKLGAYAAFDNGVGYDLYRLAYGRAFNVDPGSVLGEQRQLGKVMELALGFGGAVGAFTVMARLYGMEMDEDAVLALVRAWRTSNPAIKAFWYALERTAIEVIRCPGVTMNVGHVRLRRDGAWLKLALPSGRGLCYPNPQVVRGGECIACDGTGKGTEKHTIISECVLCEGSGKVNDDKPRIRYEGISPYTRRWGKVGTYGGKLAENLTQAASRDVFAEGMLRAERAGYPVVLSVHDELITETPDDPRFSAPALEQMMTVVPAWADGLPLAAKGFEAQRYGKEI